MSNQGHTHKMLLKLIAAVTIPQGFRPLALSSVAVGLGLLLAFGESPRLIAQSRTLGVKQVAQVPAGATVIYVNPTTGTDSGNLGTAAAPFKTLTYALSQVATGVPTVIQLAAGRYAAESGETFPLKLKKDVTLLGDEATKGQGITIVGSGKALTKALGTQEITIVTAANSVIRGITVTNPQSRGTGIVAESTNPVIANNTFTGTGREGIYLMGKANAIVGSNIFIKNTGNGVSISQTATGTVTDNLFQENGFGIAIGNTATTTITGNQITQNISGIYMNGDATPTLRNNSITGNRENGIVIGTNSNPNLGTAADNGRNIIKGNNTAKAAGAFDLNNATKNTIEAVGNDVDKTSGAVNLSNVVIPTPTPIPTPSPTPSPTVPPSPSPLPSPTVPPSPSPSPTVPPSPSPSPLPSPTVPPSPLPSPSPTVPPSPTPAAFKDVPANHWAKDFIETLAANGVISGFSDGSFKPDAPVTRAQFAALINKAYAPAAKREAPAFKDVPSSYWAYNAIQTAAKGEFMSGYTDLTFKPEQNIPRVQIVVAIANGLMYGRQTADLSVLDKLTDGASIPNYAKNPVAAGMPRRLLVNYPTPATFNPNRQATRAEVAALIYQSLADLGRVPASTSPYIFKP